MNSVPQHLHSEDRQEYERIVDEALRSARHRPELAAVGQRLNTEQLRTMALNATALITATAATEYQRYVKAREELRHPAPSTPAPSHESGSGEPGTGSVGLAAALGEAAQAAAAARWHRLARLISRGVAAQRWAGMSYGRRLLAAVIGLHVRPDVPAATAAAEARARNRMTWDAADHRDQSEEATRARDAWREALLERGLLPFLREALADPGTVAPPFTPPASISRLPHLGYDRPGFSSPDDGAPRRRPSYTSPDSTSPDFGGPEHHPE